MKNLLKIIGTTMAAAMAVTAAPLVLPRQHEAKAEVTEAEGMAVTAGFDMLFNGTLTAFYSYRKENHTLKGFWKSEDFWKAYGQGIIAGGLMWSGKELMYQTDQPGVPIAGKFLHSGAVSMRDNVMEGLPWYSRYELDIGPARLSLEGMDKKPSFNVSLMPTPVFAISYYLNQGYQFDQQLSLETLTPVFTFDGIKETPEGIDYQGVAISNVVAVSRPDPSNVILGHELIHTTQHKECSFFDVMMLDAYYRKGGHGRVPDFLANHLRIGSDAGQGLLALPNLFGEEAYEAGPLEYEANYGYKRF